MAGQTDKGTVLASSVFDTLRHRHIIIPTLDVVERVSAEAITRANRRICEALSEPLWDAHRHRLDDLLRRRQEQAAVPGVRQGHKRQGAPARTHQPGADRRQAIGPRPVRRHRGCHVLRCCNTCRRWAGSTSTCPAITSGAAAPRSARSSSGRYDRPPGLSVRFFPFSEATPPIVGRALREGQVLHQRA